MPKSSPAQIAITLEMLSARAQIDWPNHTDNHRAAISRKALTEARTLQHHLSAYVKEADSQSLPLEFMELATALGLKLTEIATAMEQEDQTMRLIARRLYGTETDGQIKGGVAELLGEITENLSCTGMLNPDHVDEVRQLDEQFRQDRQTASERPLLALANLVPRLTAITRLSRAGNQMVSDALKQALPTELFGPEGADEDEAELDLGSEADWFGDLPADDAAATPPPTLATLAERATPVQPDEDVDISDLGTADFEIITELPKPEPPPVCLPAAVCAEVEQRLDSASGQASLPDIIDFPDREDDFFGQVAVDGAVQGLD